MDYETKSDKNWRSYFQSPFTRQGRYWQSVRHARWVNRGVLSSEQIERQGKILADTHQLEKRAKRRQSSTLLRRLEDNRRVLLSIHDKLAEDANRGEPVVTAGEWLLDNYYVIEEQMMTAAAHLPKGYARQLPRLVGGESAGMPRIYDIACRIVEHSDGKLNAEQLIAFIEAYQGIKPLKLGELWALPIMLRLALIEYLRQSAEMIDEARSERRKAAIWVERMIESARENPDRLIMALASMVRREPEISSSFTAELVKRLRRYGKSLLLPMSWLNSRLHSEGRNIDDELKEENRLQAVLQLAIGNCVTSLRLIDSSDWKNFVEQTSSVERTLRKDPGGIYQQMDFDTRDRYRHMIERLAKHAGLSEERTAAEAVELAESSKQTGKRSHVGYYLIDDGIYDLAARIGLRPTCLLKFQIIPRTHPYAFYFGLTALFTLLTVLAFVRWSLASQLPSAVTAAVALISLIAGMGLATALSDWIVGLTTAPRPLPKMDFSRGIPKDYKTLVAVPTMLCTPEGAERLAYDLEVRYLANRDDNVIFALLTDFRDSPQEEAPGDDGALEAARAGIAALNKKYAAAGSTRFFLLHRPRIWNETEKIWMGHERKRGKLCDLNRLILNGEERRFSTIEGDVDSLRDVRIVITLDTDTMLPLGSVRKLVGAAAHIINLPLYDEGLMRVTSGHGILQPRVSDMLSHTPRTWYSRITSDDIGIDPYTRSVSNVYQDLFDEGSFIGKGLYFVRTFDQALGNVFPENRILSHDLLEGSIARSGLVSDCQIYESSPDNYLADAERRHRWIRGDWQIASWLFPKVPSASGRTPNPLSGLSRWKVFDNLRRSLRAASICLLYAIGWLFSAIPGVWTLAVTALIVTPLLAGLLSSLAEIPENVTFKDHIKSIVSRVPKMAAKMAFAICTLPHEAYYSTDAIVRSLYRLCVSRSSLLEWKTAAESERTNDTKALSFLARMWFAPTAAAITAAAVGVHAPTSLLPGLPVLLLWGLSPLAASIASRQQTSCISCQLDNEAIEFLRLTARRTWTFLEEYVTAEENWLPPDNYQESPGEVTAHRTSPTNIGLYLLSALAAADFGFITSGGLIERVDRTLNSMNGLERYRGHFLNWYETTTTKPLHPRYVSSVDSGNLIGHLITLKAGLAELADRPIIDGRFFSGLDALAKLALESQDTKIHNSQNSLLLQVRERIGYLRSREKPSPGELRQTLESISADLHLLAAHAVNPPIWADKLAKSCAEGIRELRLLLPWAWQRQGYIDPEGFDSVLSLREIAEIDVAGVAMLRHDSRAGQDSPRNREIADIQKMLAEAGKHARARISRIDKITALCDSFTKVDYSFLYDPTRKQLAIGFNVDELRPDSSYYDLLASEARLAVYVGIAQGKLPQSSWFALGRRLTESGKLSILLSWSGSMFEYLMPDLVMPSYNDTLLHETCCAAVSRQVSYAASRKLPWGISESGYNSLDSLGNYQYRAFGVPGLGLRRGLADDYVIAPYATALALQANPAEAYKNLVELKKAGFMGKYGFYEAVDYTKSRLPIGQSEAVVKSYMAHHQGMSLLAYDNTVNDGIMQKRFADNPAVRASLLLLQERIPESIGGYEHIAVYTKLHEESAQEGEAERPHSRVVTRMQDDAPNIQLLANDRYRVMQNQRGGGYSTWKDYSITRWRKDLTADNSGTFCYLRDRSNGKVWSVSYGPTRANDVEFQAVFAEGRVEFHTRAESIEAKTTVAVSPEDDIEIRRVRLSNRSAKPTTIEATSCCEIALARQADEEAHPAFSNLFIQSEILREQGAILFTRRRRNPDEESPWAFHMLVPRISRNTDLTYESSREKFVGRCRTLSNPRALEADTADLSGSEGAVIDPIAAIRGLLPLQADESVTFDIVTGAADCRENAVALIEKYRDKSLADRVFDISWTHSQIQLQQLGVSQPESQLYNQLAGYLVYNSGALRAETEVRAKNRKGQSGLWGYSISGDLPIVLLVMTGVENMQTAKHLLKAQSYWRSKGLSADLVIWNDDKGGYRQTLHDEIMQAVAGVYGSEDTAHPGGVFVRNIDMMADEDRILFLTVASIIIYDSHGSLEEQIDRIASNGVGKGGRRIKSSPVEGMIEPPLSRDDLVCRNPFGGFTEDGREYIVTVGKVNPTPAPWINVLSNPTFGTIVSEAGSSCTWSENAHEFRLTPWHNDPVTDTTGEAIYIRDQDGSFWSPTAHPVCGQTPYATRHGFGYSIFEHTERQVRTELTVFVAVDVPVKFSRLIIKNLASEAKELSVTGYVEWVLGDLRSKTAPHVATEIESGGRTIFARNTYSGDFPEREAFFSLVEGPSRGGALFGRTSSLINREAFIGAGRSLGAPAAMNWLTLKDVPGGRIDSADPCAAIATDVILPPNSECELIFILGACTTSAECREYALSCQTADVVEKELKRVWEQWNRLLGTVKIASGNRAFDMTANGWLLYQTIGCRLWARNALYQSGGAIGFRDQLQDAMSLVHADSSILKKQIVTAAAHQFEEGDVMHWWHPPTERGVRTLCSDDYLWLPAALWRYIESTDDWGILDEQTHYLKGRPLEPGEESYYDLPQISEKRGDMYDHALQAVIYGLKFGRHGLPLIGAGDWNDGMNAVGIEGRGESVWLAFFLYSVLEGFMKIAERKQDHESVRLCAETREKLASAVKENGWDGEWFRRAYFDDGTPLGSHINSECTIDSISQSWSVISGMGAAHLDGWPKIALQSLYERLLCREGSLVRLLTPPFDTSELNPGYIKGYLPGVRENGGQYTHAAIWAAMAFAEAGDVDRAWELAEMINPVNHGRTPEEIEIYKTEPYAVAADVYAAEKHVGRGGWSWYTGSAAWMYRLIVESLIGLKRRGNSLEISPRLPVGKNISVEYRYGGSLYKIIIRRDSDSPEWNTTLDGKKAPNPIPLIDDAGVHDVSVYC